MYLVRLPKRPSRRTWRRLLKDGIQTQRELSLRQRSPFVLFEYSVRPQPPLGVAHRLGAYRWYSLPHGQLAWPFHRRNTRRS